MKNYKPYDESNPKSIEEYSQELIGNSFKDVLEDYYGDDSENYNSSCKRYNNPRGKGSLGNLIEEYFFGYQPNNSPEPDFPEAGVELKVTPYEKTKTGKIRAGERLVLGMIPNREPIPLNFNESNAFDMLKLTLLIFYYRDRELDRIDYPIHYSQLFSIESEQLKKDYEIIKSDYKIIADKIRAGKAHELSEADTMYLGAATKGATAKSSLQSQYYSDIPAKRRAFSLKQRYMSVLLNDYIIKGVKTSNEIVSEPVSLETFEKIVIDKLMKYRGFSERELRAEFSLIDSTSKNIHSILALRILDVYTDTAEEFEKSNTILKTIRLEENNRIIESMSFPAINFMQFSNEDWEDSELNNYFSETRFLFVIFKNHNNEYYLDDAIFWHMSVKDLDEIVKKEWIEAQKVVNEGVNFTVSGTRILNNLPKSKDTEIIHLRPHAQKAAYKIDSLNILRGNIQRDGDILPNGDIMTKQSFWLNNKFLEKELLN